MSNRHTYHATSLAIGRILCYAMLLHDDLHWLGIPDRVAFNLIITVHRCLNGRAPNYLLNHVILVSAIVSRQCLRSAQQNTLVVPRYRLTTYSRRAFSVAGPTAWNSLPVTFRDPTISDACFRRHLKTVLFAQQRRHHSVYHVRDLFMTMRCINSRSLSLFIKFNT